ncbi:MAG: isoprenyl transferase [Bacteroidales bacterium]|jgi:undecaprenyl diphosphate synthase|nr:isoprenyl transferase [Bacteroidales bacterium]
MDNLPKHIAIIMDGNGRWAQQHGLERYRGHEAGVDAVRKIVTAAAEIGIKYLTLYAFSTENWKRPKEEVDALMDIFVRSLNAELPTMLNNNIKLRTIGDTLKLRNDTQMILADTLRQTDRNNGLNLVLALNYGARDEITKAVFEIVKNIQENDASIFEISPEIIVQHLYTKDMPDPDLLIRTSGEQRLSNFLLWQCAYTEFFFTDTLWPDFNKEELLNIIKKFQNRERRFGGIEAS